jgi:hypothetical protein
MASVAATLKPMIENEIDPRMVSYGSSFTFAGMTAGARGYGGPLSQPNPVYFKHFCQAVATGISDGSTVINFTTADLGLQGAPSVAGAGTGVGVIVDDLYMSEKMYTAIRTKIMAAFPSSGLIPPWDPGVGSYGSFLKAITDGIAKAVKDHFATAYNLVSAHPLVYMGTGQINATSNKFSGLDQSNIKSLIQAAGTMMQGPAWPVYCDGIAEGYVDGIHNKSTGTVVIAGTCVPSMAQVCGIGPAPGVGSGTAI